MSRVWRVFIAVAAASAAAVLITLGTPANPVPVVSFEGFTYQEAERTLREVALLLIDDPTLTVDHLKREYPLLSAIEGREPAGVAWAALGLVTAFLGALAWTRADNRFGKSLIAVGVASAVLGISRAVSDFVVRSASEWKVVPQVAFAFADILWVPLGVLLGPWLLLTLPNGRLPSARWRWVPWVSALASTFLAVQLLHPLRYDGRALAPYTGVAGEIPERLFSAGIYLWMLALAAAGTSLLVRFLRSTGAERDQLKWITYGLVVSLALLALSDFAQRFGGDPAFWGPVASAGFFVVLPLTFVGSVFRYRLLSVDLVINRTALFGVLSLIVALTYLSAVAIAGSIFGREDLRSTLIAMVATAIAFEPLRMRTMALIDRLVWRRTMGPRDALSEVFTTIEHQHDLDEGMATIVEAIAAATSAQCVAMWLEAQKTDAVVATYPSHARLNPDDLWDHVESIGENGAVGLRMSVSDRLRRKERRLVNDLAKLANGLIENTKLRSELDDIVAELERRQSELIAAEARLDDVFRRAREDVERDLHDGAQARAVALASLVGLARVAPSSELKQQISVEVDVVEETVAAFANGLYPATLRTDGLADAIRDQARLVLPDATIHVDSCDIPEDVGCVAYMVASEAILNVAKHARPTTNPPEIECSTSGSELTVVVCDDGRGFSTRLQLGGSGLMNIRERVEALGGSLQIQSAPGSGTRLRATIPFAR